MIWLASYPRSGNTFFRIVLREVYGIETAEFDGPSSPENYLDYQLVKTHLLPDDLVPQDPTIPSVYLVRDGRDAVVSMARQRSDLIVPGSGFRMNMLRIILSRWKSRFGGWSRHVKLWRQRASLVIRFEDLIVDPIGCVERVRPWLDLPPPREDRLPSFQDLRSRGYTFNRDISPLQVQVFRERFFRRGKVGAWRDEMPRTFEWLFRFCHGKMLKEMGYR